MGPFLPGHLVAPSRSAGFLGPAERPQQVTSSRRRGGCGRGATQLPTAGAAAVLRSGTNQYAVQVQPLLSDVSAAGYKSLERSLPRFCSLLSPERPPPRPRICRQQQSRRLGAKQRRGELTSWMRTPGSARKTRTFASRPPSPSSPPGSRQRCLSRRTHLSGSCWRQQVQKGGVV